MTTRTEIEAMIARVALGDRAAFRSLYDATSAKLFGVCLGLLGNRAEAEEVLQDAFVRIWQMADRYSSNGLSPMTWLITIARNLAIDRLRARKPESFDIADAGQVAADGPSPEDSAIAASEAARIVSCLEELDRVRAAAVRGAYLGGLTYADLSARFDVPLNTMRTWLRRSLIQLRECMSR